MDSNLAICIVLTIVDIPKQNVMVSGMLGNKSSKSNSKRETLQYQKLFGCLDAVVVAFNKRKSRESWYA